MTADDLRRKGWTPVDGGRWWRDPKYPAAHYRERDAMEVQEERDKRHQKGGGSDAEKE